MREATVEDVPAVRAVADRAWRVAYASVLRERAVVRVETTVLAGNDVGRSFYESRGFAVSEAYDDDLFGETVRALTYAWTV